MSSRLSLAFVSLKALFALSALFLLACSLSAEIKADRAKISTGALSSRIMRLSVCQFFCMLSNSDNVDKTVQLRVIADIPQINVYTYSVLVPAKSELAFQAPIFMENAEKCSLDVFVDGRRLPVSRDNEMLIQTLNNRISLFAIIEDSTGGIGSFHQLPSFKDKTSCTIIKTLSAPSSYLQYKDCKAVIIGEISPNLLNARQIQALLDYAAQGGTIVIGNPKAALAIAQGPLAALLPVEPLRIRQIDKLPALAKISPNFKGFALPVDMLESVAPKEEGINLLADSQFSIVRSKRFGLGVVRLSAIAPAEASFPGDSATWEAFLQLLLSGQRHLPDYSGFSSSLDQMTGFKTPSLSVVRLILVIYLVLLLAVIATGFIMKRAGLAWAAAALLAALGTLAILEAAKLHFGKKGKLLTSIRLQNVQTGAGSAESYCSFYSDKAFSLDSHAERCNSLVTGMLPNTNRIMPMGMTATTQDSEDSKLGSGSRKRKVNAIQFSTPIDLRRTAAGLFGFQGMNVSANSSRQFLYREGGLEGISFESLPELAFGPDGISLRPWTVPASIKFESAFLAMPSGVFSLDRSGQSLSLPERQSLFQADLISKSISEAVIACTSSQTPQLLLVGRGSGPDISTGGEPTRASRNVMLVPVVSSASSKSISIPGSALLLQGTDSSSRFIMEGNSLKADYDLQGASAYSLQFALPAFLPSGFAPKEITIKLSSSSGGNIKITPTLYPKAQLQSTAKASLLKGVESSSGTFVFSKDISEVVNPLTGIGYFQIEAFERDPNASESVRMKSNSWRLISLSVSMKGELPEGQAPFKF